VNRNHNRSNEITDVDEGQTGGDPTYDKDGNTTRIDRPLVQSRDYSFDAWNRLVEVKYAGNTLAYYHYDGLGRRIQDSQGDRDYYYSEAWQLLTVRDGHTLSEEESTLEVYRWGTQYVDEILSRSTSSELLYYIQDANWNVQTLVSNTGVALERMGYDSYAAPSFFDGSWGTRTSSAYGNAVLFTGRPWNATSRTYEFRHREQSPYLGRFLQTDPVGTAILFSSRPAHMTSAHMTGGSWGDPDAAGNPYSYISNDPLNDTDPIGLRPGKGRGLWKVSEINALMRQSMMAGYPHMSKGGRILPLPVATAANGTGGGCGPEEVNPGIGGITGPTLREFCDKCRDECKETASDNAQQCAIGIGAANFIKNNPISGWAAIAWGAACYLQFKVDTQYCKDMHTWCINMRQGPKPSDWWRWIRGGTFGNPWPCE
jgi:hypothetical protein